MVSTDFYRWDGDSLKLRVKVIPRARQNIVAGPKDGMLYVRLTAPPVKGRANQALVKMLAKLFKVTTRQVEVSRGQSNARKLVTIQKPGYLPGSLEITAKNMD